MIAIRFSRLTGMQPSVSFSSKSLVACSTTAGSFGYGRSPSTGS
jgi:hypothetical protein